ncbi:MAG: hypothetical protein ACXVZZ_04950 [Terriglobales bacterium]
MIKSLHKLLFAKREQDYRALVEFFDALGLARGETWDGRRSMGVKFDAREAGVEIGMGVGFPDADLVIETDSADTVYEIAEKRGFKSLKRFQIRTGARACSPWKCPPAPAAWPSFRITVIGARPTCGKVSWTRPDCASRLSWAASMPL